MHSRISALAQLANGGEELAKFARTLEELSAQARGAGVPAAPPVNGAELEAVALQVPDGALQQQPHAIEQQAPEPVGAMDLLAEGVAVPGAVPMEVPADGADEAAAHAAGARGGGYEAADMQGLMCYAPQFTVLQSLTREDMILTPAPNSSTALWLVAQYNHAQQEIAYLMQFTPRLPMLQQRTRVVMPLLNNRCVSVRAMVCAGLM